MLRFSHFFINRRSFRVEYLCIECPRSQDSRDFAYSKQNVVLFCLKRPSFCPRLLWWPNLPSLSGSHCCVRNSFVQPVHVWVSLCSFAESHALWKFSDYRLFFYEIMSNPYRHFKSGRFPSRIRKTKFKQLAAASGYRQASLWRRIGILLSGWQRIRGSACCQRQLPTVSS